jgi:hypothetical protein
MSNLFVTIMNILRILRLGHLLQTSLIVTNRSKKPTHTHHNVHRPVVLGSPVSNCRYGYAHAALSRFLSIGDILGSLTDRSDSCGEYAPALLS